MRDNKYWDTCNDQSIRQKVAEFIDNSPLLSKFKGEKYYELEDAIVDLIEQNKGSIHATVEKENKVYDTCNAIGEETYSIEFFGHYTKEGKKK